MSGQAAPLARRVSARLSRERRRAWAGARHPRLDLGANCDVRSGLHLSIGATGSVVVGERVVLDRGLTMECDGRIVIGERTVFGHHCTVAARELVQIGRWCLIAEMVSIRDHDHAFEDLTRPVLEQGDLVAPVVIGDNVWIGGKATITRGVTIGDDAVIGAGAVVTRDVPAGAIALGVPARVVRYRTNYPGAPSD